ncbi:MAG: rRNA pseudouridine synthase [Myxococcales bacterium]|nr:rRNA pseudouridine synthase [Myxococcales bacterium]
MRVNKYLSESGACSRREADTFIEEGRVTVNGVPAVLGTQVADGDDVRLDGDSVGTARKNVKPVYIALNKPVGITCTTERNVAGNIVDFVDHPERVFPIGRLDKDSEGLILLTNDGDIVNEVLRAEHHHEKEYVVAVDHAITPEFLTGMASGVRLSDATTKRCKVERLGAKLFKITLTQGLNRQIRRMCEALGYTVEALKRIRIMHIHLGQLAVGRWRNLTPHEVEALFPPKTASSAQPQGGGYSKQGAGGGPQRSGGGSQAQKPGGSPPQRVRHPSHGPRPGGAPNAPRPGGSAPSQRPGAPQGQRPGGAPGQRAGGAPQGQRPGPSGRGGPPPRRSGPPAGGRGRRGRG